MRAFTFRSFCAWLALIAVPCASYGQDHSEETCDDYYERSIYLPISISFERANLRIEGIYRSLTPVLMISDQSYRPRDTTFDAISGTTTLHFCVLQASDYNGLNDRETEELDDGTMRLGLSEYEISLDETTIEEWREETGTQTHAPIIVRDVSDPDWIIPLRADLQRGRNGLLFVDLRLYNPTGNGILGPEIAIELFKPSVCSCSSPGQTFSMTTQIKLSTATEEQESTASVFATDAEFDDLIERDANYSSNACLGGAKLEIDLGGLPVVVGGNVNHYRWKIEIDEEETRGKNDCIQDNFAFGQLSFFETRIWPRKMGI